MVSARGGSRRRKRAVRSIPVEEARSRSPRRGEDGLEIPVEASSPIPLKNGGGGRGQGSVGSGSDREDDAHHVGFSPNHASLFAAEVSPIPNIDHEKVGVRLEGGAPHSNLEDASIERSDVQGVANPWVEDSTTGSGSIPLEESSKQATSSTATQSPPQTPPQSPPQSPEHKSFNSASQSGVMRSSSLPLDQDETKILKAPPPFLAAITSSSSLSRPPSPLSSGRHFSQPRSQRTRSGRSQTGPAVDTRRASSSCERGGGGTPKKEANASSTGKHPVDARRLVSDKGASSLTSRARSPRANKKGSKSRGIKKSNLSAADQTIGGGASSEEPSPLTAHPEPPPYSLLFSAVTRLPRPTPTSPMSAPHARSRVLSARWSDYPTQIDESTPAVGEMLRSWSLSDLPPEPPPSYTEAVGGAALADEVSDADAV
jgi:hypothetical protein